MKKNQTLILVIIVLLVASAGGYFFLNRGSSPISMPGEIKKEEGANDKEFVGKLKDAVRMGVPYKCTFKNNQFEGTGYLKGKMYFAEVKNNEMEGFIIMKDNCMWNWNKDGSQGVKMCFETEDGEDIFDMEDETAGSPEGEYRCTPSIIDDSKFSPPNNVKFMDLDKQMQELNQDADMPESLEE
jgi:hypothetical protein